MNSYELVSRADEAVRHVAFHLYPGSDKPDVTLENYKEVFPYYKENQLGHSPIATFGEAAAEKVFSPRIEFMDGAAEEIEQLRQEGLVPALLSNHESNFDPFLLAGIIGCLDELEDMKEDTRIPAKIKLFKRRLTRYLLEGMGARPIYREEDVKRDDDGEPVNPEEEGLLAAAGLAGVKYFKGLARNKTPLAGFPPGSRNQGDPSVVGDFKEGFALMLTDSYYAIPLALHYGGNIFRRPSVVIGRPIRKDAYDKRDHAGFMGDVQAAVQECLDNTRPVEGTSLPKATVEFVKGHKKQVKLAGIAAGTAALALTAGRLVKKSR